MGAESGWMGVRITTTLPCPPLSLLSSALNPAVPRLCVDMCHRVNRHNPIFLQNAAALLQHFVVAVTEHSEHSFSVDSVFNRYPKQVRADRFILHPPPIRTQKHQHAGLSHQSSGVVPISGLEVLNDRLFLYLLAALQPCCLLTLWHRSHIDCNLVSWIQLLCPVTPLPAPQPLP